jgi:hypothetical protein
VDATGICSTFVLFVFEVIELRENLHGNENVVVLKSIEAMRVVQENVRIENKVLCYSDGRISAVRSKFRKEKPLFICGFQRCGTVHIYWLRLCDAITSSGMSAVEWRWRDFR